MYSPNILICICHKPLIRVMSILLVLLGWGGNLSVTRELPSNYQVNHIYYKVLRCQRYYVGCPTSKLSRGKILF